MNHNEVASDAVERYTLDEMQSDEREAFEEHYFDCRACSEAVRYSARMMAAGRIVAHETPVPATNVVRMPSRWKKWIPAAAAAALLMVNGGLFIAQRSVPVVANPAKTMVLAEVPQDNDLIQATVARGGSDEGITISANTKTSIAVDGDPNLRGYEVLLLDSAGRVITRVSATQNQAKNSSTLLLGPLPAGSYNLTIKGVKEDGNHTEVVTKLTVR